MRTAILRSGARGRRHWRRGLLIVAGVTYCIGALWLAVVITRRYAGTAESGGRASSPPPPYIAAPTAPPPSALSLTPPVSSGAAPPKLASALTDLRSRNLVIPVQGVEVADLRPTFDQKRGSDRRHEALDILAPRGTPVLAVEDGRIARLFASAAGGTTIYQFDPTEQYVYYYAHLDAYVDGLREGDRVSRGRVIGYVGTTGNAPKNTPHLHFAISILGPERRWWRSTPIDPYVVWHEEGG